MHSIRNTKRYPFSATTKRSIQHWHKGNFQQAKSSNIN